MNIAQQVALLLQSQHRSTCCMIRSNTGKKRKHVLCTPAALLLYVYVYVYGVLVGLRYL